MLHSFMLVLMSVIVFCFPSVVSAPGLARGLSGSDQPCEVENERYHNPMITSDPCLDCRCKNKTVVCTMKKCSSLDKCPVIDAGQLQTSSATGKQCCQTCKSCHYLGLDYLNDQQWMSSQDSCRRLSCKGGIVTMGRIQCVSPCRNPVKMVGYCCPVCPHNIASTSLSHLTKFSAFEDPCVQCNCEGTFCHCFKSACPTLDCAEEDQETASGSCCPECKKRREDLILPNRCIFRNRVYRNEQSFRPDQCTLCKCQDGAVICRKFVCPPLDCPVHRLYRDPRLCCPRCRNQDPLPCTYKDETFKHSQTWQVDPCTRCRCTNAEVQCKTEQCPFPNGCPKGYHMKKVEGKCCAECEEKEATCTVYGDPHYQTFDGKAFNFQGTCRYVLTKECIMDDMYTRSDAASSRSPNFTVIVQNDPRGAKHFSWTRHVTVRLPEGVRVTLLPKKRVKVVSKLVSVPFLKLGVFSIAYDKQRNLVLRTPTGLKVVWDGNSYAEVSVSARYKGRLCGLCGNYNHDDSDDFITKWGFPVQTAHAFGQSWKLGSHKSCKNENERKHYAKIRHQQRLEKLDDELLDGNNGDTNFIPLPVVEDENNPLLLESRRIANEAGYSSSAAAPENSSSKKKPNWFLEQVKKQPQMSSPSYELVSSGSKETSSQNGVSVLPEKQKHYRSDYDNKRDKDGPSIGEFVRKRLMKIQNGGNGQQRNNQHQPRRNHRASSGLVAAHQLNKLCSTENSEKWQSRKLALQQCNLLRSELYRTCHEKVPVERYYKSCLMDSCACPPSGRCYCESLLAYAMRCEKENITISWRRHTECSDESTGCPIEGAVFTTCASRCIETCQNRHNLTQMTACSALPCLPGCACPEGMVLFQDKCISENKCPAAA